MQGRVGEWSGKNEGEAYKGAAERFRRRCLAAVPLEGLFHHGRPLRRDHAAASVAFGVEEIREAILDGIEAQLSQEEVEHLRKQRGEGGDAWAIEFGSCEIRDVQSACEVDAPVASCQPLTLVRPHPSLAARVREGAEETS